MGVPEKRGAGSGAAEPAPRKRPRGWGDAPGRPLGGEVSAFDCAALEYSADRPLATGELVVVPRSGGRLSYASVLDPHVPARLDVGDGCVKQLHPVFVGRLSAAPPTTRTERARRAVEAAETLEGFARDNAPSIANNASVVDILASLLAHQSRRLFACFTEAEERAEFHSTGTRPRSLAGALLLGSAAQDAALREAQAQLAEQQQRQARALETLRGQMHDVFGLAIAEVQAAPRQTQTQEQ